MGALLVNHSFLHDHNLVCISDCGQAMSDDYDSLLRRLDQRVKSLLHLMLALGIKRTGSLIKKDNLWLAHESPSNGDSLLLAAGKAYASFTDFSVESLREQDLIFDESQCIGLPARLTQSIRDFGFSCVSEVHTIQYVVLNTAREQHWLLLNQGYLRLVIPLVIELLDVLP